MPVPSWDLTLGVIFLTGIAFGYILQREKIVATLLSAYVALIITQAVAGNIQDFFQGERTINQFWLHFNASSFSVRTTVFLGTIVLLSSQAPFGGEKAKGLLTPLEIIIYSILTTGLIVCSVFYFMPAETRLAFTESSKIAALVIKNYTIWLVAPAGFMIVSSFFKKD
jgi:cytochrome c oxidase subunit IV